MPGFIEKSKVPFNSVKNLVANKYLDVENNESEEINSACDFVSGELSENNGIDSEIVQETEDNRAKSKGNRLDGVFVSKRCYQFIAMTTRKARKFSSFKRT